MEVPEFLFHLLDQELQRIQEELLEKVADRYKLDIATLREEFITPLQIIPQETEKVFLCKKQKGRQLPNDDVRCTARIWNRGKGGQCTRFRKGEYAFCCQHIEKRKHGTITETPPREVFCHKTKSLYK